MPITSTRPIVERIAVALKERLDLLVAGYSSSLPVSEVIRPTRFGGFTPKHLQIVLTQEDPEELPDLFIPGNPPAVAYRQQFNIRVHLMPSEKDPTPVEEYINVAVGDVVRVVTDAGDQWFNWDGLALDSRWSAPEHVDADGSLDGVNVPLLVTYRTSELNPYVVR